METKSITVTTDNNVQVSQVQTSHSTYLIIGGGICVCTAGAAVGLTMLILYVWAAPSPIPPKVTALPILDYSAYELTKCSRAISVDTPIPSPSVTCNFGEATFGPGLIFSKDKISSDTNYFKLSSKLYTALLSIYEVIVSTPGHQCTSTTSIINNICSNNSSSVTCQKILNHGAYLRDKIFSNLTIKMVNQDNNVVFYNEISKSLLVSSTDYDLFDNCYGIPRSCFTGIILNTFLNDTCGE